jgi:hypothetical protein
MDFVLILVFYSSTFMAMTSVPFHSQAECEAAGVAAKKLETSFKSINYVCVARTKEKA